MSDDGTRIGPTAEGSAHGGASGSLGAFVPLCECGHVRDRHFRGTCLCQIDVRHPSTGGDGLKPCPCKGYAPIIGAGQQPRWPDEPEHLRDDAPYRICNACGRHSWGNGFADPCAMTQPNGLTCPGTFGGRVWPDGATS